MRALFLILLIPAIAFGQTATADQSITNFYRAYRELKFSGLPDSQQTAKLVPHLSKGLRAALKKAQAEQARCVKAHPNDKPPWSEGDLFSSNFEGFTSVKVGTATKGEYSLEFTYIENGKTIRWQDRVAVVKENGGWVIDDVVYGRAHGFTSGYGANLRKSLSSAGCSR